MILCDGAIIRDLLRRRKNAVAHIHVTREYMNGFLCFKQACRNAYFLNFLKSGIATCGCSSFGLGKKTGGIPSQRHLCMWFWSRPRRRHRLYAYGWRMAGPIFVKFVRFQGEICFRRYVIGGYCKIVLILQQMILSCRMLTFVRWDGHRPSSFATASSPMTLRSGMITPWICFGRL
jgi:hypothetical protein